MNKCSIPLHKPDKNHFWERKTIAGGTGKHKIIK
jgi:hypothetical protein